MKSLERAIRALEFLTSTDKTDWSISELRDQTGFSLSTLHRILAAWQSLGFVQQDPRTRRYRPGLKLMELGMAVWRRLDIRSVARPVMRRLAMTVRESVYLTVREGLNGVIIDRVDSPAYLRTVQPIGLRLPLHAGGSKKVLIAYLPEDELEEVLAQIPWTPLTPHTVVDPDTFRANLARIRERGYEVSFGETEVGSAGVATPIWGAEGRVVAGLMTAGPEADFTPERLESIIQGTVQAGKEISTLLGYTENSKPPVPSRVRSGSLEVPTYRRRC
ncbi:MAG: IclR family transcriptional regulator [Actinobacteria bacterium]|nr:IclR family transcriptional regulator [Actinomycetota bacterium]